MRLVGWCLLVWLFAAALLHAPARAQTVAPEADSSPLKEAVAAYERGELEQARALFEALHAQKPTARTYRALGVIAFRQARYREAEQLLAYSLTSPIKPLTEELAQGARTLLEQTRAKLDADEPDLPAVIDPSLAGEPERQEAPVAAPTPVSKPLPPPDWARARSTSARGRRMRLAGWSMLGFTAASGLVALVGTAVGLKRLNAIEDACVAQDGCTHAEATREMRRKHMDLWSGLSIGGAIAAGVGAASTTWLLIDGYRRDRDTHRDYGLSVAVMRSF